MLSEFFHIHNKIEEQTMHKRLHDNLVEHLWARRVCCSVVVFDMPILLVPLVDVANLTFEF